MIYHLFLFAAITASFFAEEFIPYFAWAYYSRLLLVHVTFYCAAVTVPFPSMLFFALYAGFVWDARHHLPVSPGEGFAHGIVQAELPFGFTILVFGLMGAFLQGVRPLFRRGRWELPVLLVGGCTGLGMLLEYLMISFHRGALRFPGELWWKILMTALFSALVSPVFLLLFSRIAAKLGYKLRTDSITGRPAPGGGHGD